MSIKLLGASAALFVLPIAGCAHGHHHDRYCDDGPREIRRCPEPVRYQVVEPPRYYHDHDRWRHDDWR